MEKARTTGRPWRSWTILALVLLTLALAQACSDSGNRTTSPTKTAGVALKVRRVAQVPAGCTGTLIVDGPNGFHLEISIPASGEVSFQAPIGVPLTLTVVLDCGPLGIFTGSTSFTAGPGNNQAAVTVVATQAGVACSPSTVAPGQPSNCVCTIKSPTPPTVTWQGATPTGLTTATFSNTTPGTYTVTCTVNNATSASTTVTVTANTGTITVNSTLTEGSLDVAFTGGLSAMNNIPPGDTRVKNNAPTGNYTATAFWCGECSCSVQFTLDIDENQVLNLPSDCD